MTCPKKTIIDVKIDIAYKERQLNYYHKDFQNPSWHML